MWNAISRILRAIPFILLGIVILKATATRAGTLMVWGNDSFGQKTSAPVGDFRGLAVGGATQGLAIRLDRTFVLWGGEVPGEESPPIVDPAAIPFDVPDHLKNETVVGACLGRGQAALILQDKTLASWSRFRPDPIPPAGRFRELACGNRHTIALALDGTLDGWGANDVNPSTLLLPEGNYKAIAARVLYSMALQTDGTLVGWGQTPVFTTWSQIPEDPDHFYAQGRYKAIAAGISHALALRQDGSVAAWGVNPGSESHGNPLRAPEHVRFKSISAGNGFSVGIDTEGTLWGWGTPSPLVGVPLPPVSWTFAEEGWEPFGDAGHYFVPESKFKTVIAAAFHVAAITEDEAGDSE